MKIQLTETLITLLGISTIQVIFRFHNYPTNVDQKTGAKNPFE